MIYFIDCEWDETELVSISLVRDDGDSWYEVVKDSANSEWVAENVIPKLNKSAIGIDAVRASMNEYLLSDKTPIRIIADWPEDIAWFCKLMITGPGKRLKFAERVSFDFVGGLVPESKVPHNALEDAKALRDLLLGPLL